MENDPTLGLSHIAARLNARIKIISHESSNQDEQETYLTFLRITNGLDSIQVYSELCITSLFLPSMPLQMSSRRTCACRAGTTSRAIQSCRPIRTPQCRDVIGRTRHVTEIGMRQPCLILNVSQADKSPERFFSRHRQGVINKNKKFGRIN